MEPGPDPWTIQLTNQDIPRCQDLLTSMLELSSILSSPSANLSTPIQLLRARATTLSFSLLPSSTTRSLRVSDAAEDEEEVEAEAEAEADPDVLPSLLAYKDGELERKWIRVDWDIGQGDLEGLLRRYALSPHGFIPFSQADDTDLGLVKGSCLKQALTIVCGTSSVKTHRHSHVRPRPCPWIL